MSSLSLPPTTFPVHNPSHPLFSPISPSSSVTSNDSLFPVYNTPRESQVRHNLAPPARCSDILHLHHQIHLPSSPPCPNISTHSDSPTILNEYTTSTHQADHMLVACLRHTVETRLSNEIQIKITHNYTPLNRKRKDLPEEESKVETE